MESPSLEVFKKCLDLELRDGLGVTVVVLSCWLDLMILKVSSSIENSIIL